MLEFCWILLSLLLLFVASFILALFPSREIEDECKENPRYNKGIKEHRKVPYKMVFKLEGLNTFYVVHYKCKYCGQEYRPIEYRREDLKGERLFKYSKELDLDNREINLEK